MKKASIRVPAVLFILCALLLSAPAVSQAKQPCMFNGTINNVKVKSFQCDIVHGAGPSYLLIKLDFGGSYWMMDLTGVTKKAGKANFNVVLKKHDGKKFSESYSGQTVQVPKGNPNYPNLLGFFKSNIVLKDAKGKPMVVTGDFVWDISRFPK